MNDDLGQYRTRGEVTFTRLLPGPIERVWAYLTEPDKRGRWFASGPMELRAGGSVEFHFDNDNLTPGGGPAPEKYRNEAGLVSHARILRCDPPRVLSFLWKEQEGESEVTFELTPRGSGVLLVLTHRRLANRAMKVGVLGGWHAHLGVLLDRLHEHEPQPFWPTFNRLEAEYEKLVPAE